jgi:hypothetical protein
MALKRANNLTRNEITNIIQSYEEAEENQTGRSSL